MCSENSLREGLSLQKKIQYKPSRPCYLNQQPTPYQLLWYVEDQHEFLGVVVRHMLISNGFNLRKSIYICILYVGLILLMFNKATSFRS